MQLGRPQLQVRVIAAAEGKVNSKLRVELCELVQALKIFHTSCARSYIHRHPQLMSRNTAPNQAVTVFGFNRIRSARAGSFFSNAYTCLLL